MSTNEAADPVEFAVKLSEALEAENPLWTRFTLWDDYLYGKRDFHLHKMLSGIAALVAGEEIAYATSTLTLSDEFEDSSYEVIVLTEQHIVRATRDAREDWPTTRLTSRKDLAAIEILNAPITTISVNEPSPMGGLFTVKLEYPACHIALTARRHVQGRLAALIPSLVADVDA